MLKFTDDKDANYSIHWYMSEINDAVMKLEVKHNIKQGFVDFMFRYVSPQLAQSEFDGITNPDIVYNKIKSLIQYYLKVQQTPLQEPEQKKDQQTPNKHANPKTQKSHTQKMQPQNNQHNITV